MSKQQKTTHSASFAVRYLTLTGAGQRPDHRTKNLYDLTGAITNKSGSREYPVAYTFDSQGRLQTMTTWTDYATRSGAATTTWYYDKYRGWLTNKVYADLRGPKYFYTPAGRLQTRLWARGIGTTNYYGADAALTAVAYSDTTPGVAYAYDRRGRQTQITVGTSSTSSLTYNDANQLLAESYSGGPLDGITVTSTFDGLLRRTDLAVQQSNNPLIHQSMSFDAASRLLSVSDNTGNSASYNYLDYSPLVQQISFTNNGSRRMLTVKQYDHLNRLTAISNFPSAIGSSAIGYSYKYNDANQRTAITNSDATFWLFTYDSLGQVTSGKKYWPDGTPVAGQQFEYTFDDIGNRKTASSGGDANGGDLHTQSYYANNLNQYTSRTVPGYVQSLGTANTNATVTLWGSGNEYQKAYRHGDYFWAELPYDNTGNALWIGITNFGALPGGTNADIVASTKGHLFLASTPEGLIYDYDGNLTSDGQWDYTWDGENRLIKMAARSLVGPQISLQFTYDSQGRRIRKQVWDNTTWSGTPTNDLRFVYDAWNLLSELDGLNGSAPLRSYAWGLDLSGSFQGACGVGGLLEVSEISNPQNSNQFAAYDGSGNVAGLTGASDGGLAAQYEYGPSGEIVRATGPAAAVNPEHLSTRYQDEETGLTYFGYRYYAVIAGRWIGRDTANSGANTYVYVNNRSPVETDPLGLSAQDANPMGPSARDVVVAKLDEARSDISDPNLLPSDMVMSTGFPGLLPRYGMLALQIRAQFGELDPGVVAWWNDNALTLRQGRAIDPETIVHEMTHAYQGVVLHYPQGNGDVGLERSDEGEASAVAGIYLAAKRLNNDERKYRLAGCNRAAISATWKSFWRAYGVLPGIWPPIKWSANKDGAPMTKEDLGRTYRVYHCGLSCRSIANSVNEIIHASGCQFMVDCCPSDGPMEIGTAVAIERIFQ